MKRLAVFCLVVPCWLYLVCAYWFFSFLAWGFPSLSGERLIYVPFWMRSIMESHLKYFTDSLKR